MNLRALAATLILAVSANAHANLVDANLIGQTANFSHPDGNTTLTYFSSEFDVATKQYVTQSYSAGIIDSYGINPTNFFGAPRVGTRSTTFGGNTLRYAGGTQLDEMLYQTNDGYKSRFGLLLLSYIEPTRAFFFQGIGPAPEGFIVYTFDENKEKNGEYYYQPDWTNSYRHRFFDDWGWSADFRHALNFNQDVSYILFGGYDNPVYVNRFNTHLPESNLLTLLLIGFLVLLFKYRKSTNR